MSETRIRGIVKDAEYARDLSGVDVLVLGQDQKELYSTKSDSAGAWSVSWEKSAIFVRFGYKGYVQKTFAIDKVPQVVRLLPDKLTAYQEKLWFYPGEEISVFVHSSTAYSAALYRHGVEKENLLELKELPAIEQQVPDEMFVSDGLNWEKSFAYKLPSDARPGLYSMTLRSIAGEVFAVPMVVSTPESDRGHNKLLVMASTNTWLAYNLWGGRSRYLNYEVQSRSKNTGRPLFVSLLKLVTRAIRKILPFGIIVLLRKVFDTNREPEFSWMFEKLSVLRPVTNCDLEADSWESPFTNHLAAGEWRLIAWLEKMDFSYDIVSGCELDHQPELLAHYKAVLLSTHNEYWTCKMFKSMQHYHNNNGLWVLNISGNSMYREVVCDEDGSIRCISTSFKDSCADESQLTGVRFTDYDYGTCAPIKVVDHKHWLFDGAGIKSSGEVFGQQSLNQHTPASGVSVNPGRPSQGGDLRGAGASGWETDKLSSSAPGDFKLVAKGQNKYGGADLVIREPSGSRGGVFSAPSILFGGSLAVDPVCSKIVENVLRRSISD